MKTLDYLHLKENNVSNVVCALQQLLADFQVYYTNLRDFHWNIKGHAFFILHEQFENMYNDAATKIDEIAERILTLGGTPENRFSKYLEVAKIKETCGVKCGKEAIEHVMNAHCYFIGEERKLIDIASEAGDEVTVGMITDYLAEQEKMIWKLTAFCSECCEKK